ncbi:MAG: tRNA 4-thiouridine(8) synthase ThiI [Lachnospiraceae bacterium]|nr:tRNA 4-thiouridine(8) synthase ThiI [Lachnospiraceae bacterium]
MFHAFLIKYSEIGIKGKNRYLFEDALIEQIKRALARVEGEFTVSKESGRIFALAQGDYDFEGAVDALCRVFGISGICPVVILDDEGLEALGREVNNYITEVYQGKPMTFKILTRRARKSYPVNSMDVNAQIGAMVLFEHPELSVNVVDPEVYIHIEIRNRIYLYSEEIKGLGGLPLGTGGRAMLLLSGGIDSPVAGYMISRRGIGIDAVYFHAPPYTSERAKQKVVDLAKIVSQYTGKMKLHVINFTDIQLAIYDKCPHDELTIIMRRYMMRIAEHLAKEEGDLALITGESIGQVASQTMQSLSCTNAVCSLPVFRPLIAFDKQDIVEISQKIDTYETSILPFEDCCTIFVAKHPVTKPDLLRIEKSETKLEGAIEALVETAIMDHEVLEIDG